MPVKTRDAQGHWLPGQSGNKRGRPARETEREYLDVTLGICTKERWATVIEKAMEQAERGDGRAREWLGRHILGDPVQVHEYLMQKEEDIRIHVVFGPAEKQALPVPEDDVIDAEYELEDASN